jgi:hypothetical protein
MTLATPGYGKPSLLSLNEVKELLRQFGKVNSAELTKKKLLTNNKSIDRLLSPSLY